MLSAPIVHTAPAGLPGAASLRGTLRSLAELRACIARALMSGRRTPEEASRLSELWLLAALAAELLGTGGTREALRTAAAGDWTRILGTVAAIERATGLRLKAGLGGGAATPDWQGAPLDELVALRAQGDPFGLLGQELRSRRLDAAGVGSEARRGSGAFYTPWSVARRQAERALAAFDADEIPSVLDPACGAGTFLAAAFDILWRRLEARRRRSPDQVVEPVAWTVTALHGVELDPTALSAARLSLAVRAVLAERASVASGQLALFGQAATYGPLLTDRLRLGDALGAAPGPTVGGTERLRWRLLARDEPGRLAPDDEAKPVPWDIAFPLRFADEEGTFREEAGFDLVITNPPFVPVDRIPAERRAGLREALRTMQRRFDLFIGFVERARTLLAARGRAALLVPRTFLTEANAEKCRRLLLETSSLERIEELGALKFDGARVECVMLTFSARRPSETTAVELLRHDVRKPTALLQSAFRRTPRAMFRLELAEPAAEECLRVAASSVPLGRFFCAAWGARGSPVKDFHLDTPDHPLGKAMIKGDDVAPFHASASTRWLLYDPERLYRPARRELFEHEKIVIRKVSGARGIVAAVERGGLYTDDSLACVVRKADLISIPLVDRRRHQIRIAPSQIEPSRAYDLDFVCALIQTPLVQTYYRVQLGGGLNVFPKLIESLPIPKPEALALPEVAQLAALGARAAAGDPFDAIAADGLARRIFGLT